MKNQKNIPARTALGGAARPVARALALALLAQVAGSSAQAGFHQWTIREVYSDASGSLQFIELFTTFSGQGFVATQQINVTNLANTITHTFTVPSHTTSDTPNRALLFGTAGIQAAGAPAPDYIIPNGFLFQAGGNLKYFGTGSGPYSALPTDGNLSRTWGDGNAVNSPQNFAGASGHIVAVPEPATGALLVLGGLGVFLLRRRSA